MKVSQRPHRSEETNRQVSRVHQSNESLNISESASSNFQQRTTTLIRMIRQYMKKLLVPSLLVLFAMGLSQREAKAGFSIDISIGDHHRHRPPSVVLRPPVFVARPRVV